MMNKKRFQRISGITAINLMWAIGFLASGLLFAAEAVKHTPAKVSPEDLKQGLSALYFYEFWARHLDDLPSGEIVDHAIKSGKPISAGKVDIVVKQGDPIPYLNHKFGKLTTPITRFIRY